MGFITVVKVGGAVTDFIGQVDELGFERRPQIEKILGKFRISLPVVIAGMLNDAFAHFERQVQAAKGGVALFEIFDDAQSVQVMVEEESMLAHDGVERLLTRMTERRMAQIVDQSERLGQIHVEVESAGDRACDLRYFDGVGEAVAK